MKGLDLGGDLSIRGLDYVKSFEDAKNANLIAKINLTSLSLSWKESSKQESAEHFEEVLKGLQPNQNLEKIRIKFYQGSCFPKWMSTVFLPNLCEITLQSFLKCEHLPPLGKLNSLKNLKLEGMESIKRLDAEWHGDGTFPALTRLTISGMHNLEKWSKPDSIESFPCLTFLYIHTCPKLTGIPNLSSLRTLDLSRSKNVGLLKSVTDLTSITSLVLSGIAEVEALPLGLLQNHMTLVSLKIWFSSIRTLENELDKLSSLQSLDLYRCSNLEVLPEGLRHLKSLESLRISSCHSLVSIPAILFQGSSLTILSIENCEKLKHPFSGPLSSTLTLQSLFICECPELEVLPDSMQQLIALRSLTIRCCAKLCSLPNWMGYLQSLLEMKILECENLKFLPDSFQSLKSLRMLWIRRCPHLEKRCKKPDGEDWPNISHIPKIHIGPLSLYEKS